MTVFDGDRNTRVCIDWGAVELEFRIGNLSDAALARKHGTSRDMLLKRAMKYKWKRDLRGRYAVALQSRLAQESSKNLPAVAEDDTVPQQIRYIEEEERAIQGMAEAAVIVVREHRADLRRLRTTTFKLLERTEAFLDGKTLWITNEKGEIIEAPFGGGKETPADILEKISRIYVRVQGLERTAFSIDEKVKQDPITVTYNEDEKDT